MPTENQNTNTISSQKTELDLALKICGMHHNTSQVGALAPQYLGFIFWEGSTRNFSGPMPALPVGIKKVGVFVNATVTEVLETVEKYALDVVQLHGQESVDYCRLLRDTHYAQQKSRALELIKVFSIKETFDFEVLEVFESVCDFFLFDTKGKLPGGNGYVFDWSVLQHYPSKKPYFLSGGIGLDSLPQLKEFLKRPEAKYCAVIDVNSKFEEAPGLKKIEALQAFKNSMDTMK